MRFASKKRLITILAIVLIAVAFTATILTVYFWEKKHSDFDSPSDFEMAGVLEYEGEKYTVREDVQTLLVIGLDTFEKEDDASPSYNNDKCADFLSLFVFDRHAGTYSVIHLNRDTITDVTILGVGGQKIGTVSQQLALAHTYGSGSDDSCRNTARAVSKVFGGMRIDRYISITMDAVAELNDMVGGVTLTVKDDLTKIDETLKKGEVVTLRGEQALHYVRARSSVEDSTNAARMERQKQYMDALYDQMSVYVEENGSFSHTDVTSISKYMTTDCSANELDRLAEKLPTLQKDAIFSLEGEYKVGKYVEFYPYDNSVKNLLVKLFYKIKK